MNKPWNEDKTTLGNDGIDLLTAEERAGNEDPAVLRSRAFGRWKRHVRQMHLFITGIRHFKERDH